jgi:hypothetical protein
MAGSLIRKVFSADSDPDPGSKAIRIQIQILVSWKNKVYLLIVVNFLAPESLSAFSIRIRILESKINADP